MNRLPIIAFVVALAASSAYYLWPSSDNATELAGFGAAEAQESDGEIDTSGVLELTLGDPDAPLTVVEYASHTCPHCKNFHLNTFKQFKENYIDTGKVHFIYREVYFDRFGLWAGMVARCGVTDENMNRYFAISDLIYTEQASWTNGDGPAEIAENLKTIGKKAGLTAAELDACTTDGDMAPAMVAVFQEHADRDGIRSTPSFLIDGELVTGDQSYESFSALLDEKL